MTTEDEKQSAGGEEGSGSAQGSRARNRTVMLTPEITGEVRARLAKDMANEATSTAEPAREGSTSVSSSLPASESSGGGFSEAFGVPGGRAASGTEGMASHERPLPGTPAAAEAHPAMGSATTPASPSPYRIRQGVIWSKPSPLTGFLVSYDEEENGEVFELRKGRLIVTSEAPGAGNFLVIDHESVSPMHAIIRIAARGEIQLLDQLSEHGTRILRSGTGKEEELSGDKSILGHGDIVFFGERKFHVCLIADSEGE
ncbi:FHA domain-containing protein [bacterium]|nr:FHA domain-containing protein [bacterium]